MDYIVYGYTTENALIQSRDNLIAILQGTTLKAAQRTTVFLVDDYIMADIHQTTGKVTGVGSLHSGIGQTLTGTVRSEEHTSELQSRQYLVCRLLLEKKNLLLEKK